MLRGVAGVSWIGRVPDKTDPQVFEELQMPPLETLLVVARLRYVRRLVLQAPLPLRHVLDATGTWTIIMLGDLQWMQTLLPQLQHLPAPCDNASQWLALARFPECTGGSRQSWPRVLIHIA